MANGSSESVDVGHLAFCADVTATGHGPCPVNMVLLAKGELAELSAAEAASLAEWLASGVEPFVHDVEFIERYSARQERTRGPGEHGVEAGVEFILKAAMWLRSDAVDGARVIADGVPASIRDEQLPFP